MRLVTPKFVNHEGKPIFSCDIHPDGQRFATGGQGTSSGRIAIWNLLSVLDEAVDSDENVPKCLCLLDNHANCVNVVRWSNSGKNLASGGDDKLIMIWMRVGEPRVNSNGVPCGVEQWRCAHTLSSHESVVLDLAWDPHDTRLASCSVDNSVIVWNMDGKPVILARLMGHTGLVKGVAWDPVGEYLSSQSDDKSLRIWRTSDWKEHISITEPFQECSDVTHVLRLDWSPDGQYVVSAHASNSGGPTAQIIERANDAEKKCWLAEMDYVGHRKAVTCVKFNKNLMVKSPSEKKFCLLATGSRDCSIAVWTSQKRRPIVAIKHCFGRAVVDMSWGRDGNVLMACSWDGSVLFLDFMPDEIGHAITADEKLATLENLYGKRVVHGKVEPIVEFPEFLDTPQEDEKPAAVEEKPDIVPVVVKPAPIVVAKQIEVKRADGKRRITPIMLPTDAPNSPCTFMSQNSTTKVVVEQVTKKATVKETEMKISVDAVKEPVISTISVSTIDAPSPPKRKKLPFVSGDSAIATPPASALQPKFDPRPAVVQLRALGLAGAVRVLITDSDDVIVIDSQKDPPLCKVRRETRNPISVLWENVLAHNVVAAKCNSTLSVFFCFDRSVHIINSNSGAPLRLPILLPGSAACVDLSRNNRLCVVTTCGYVLVWDLTKNKLIMRDSTLKAELLINPNAFSLCRLKDDGLPVVIFNNGRSFSYTMDMGWQLLTDVKAPLWQLGRPACLQVANLPFNRLVREVRALTGGPAVSVRSNSVQSATATQCATALLYQQLHAADGLGSHEEVKSAILSLIGQLAKADAVRQIRDLLDNVATPRGLLPDSLAVIKGFLNCQRLYAELVGTTLDCDDLSLGPPMDCS